jgi:hypothetical protein
MILVTALLIVMAYVGLMKNVTTLTRVIPVTTGFTMVIVTVVTAISPTTIAMNGIVTARTVVHRMQVGAPVFYLVAPTQMP